MDVLKILIGWTLIWSVNGLAMTIPADHVAELTKLDGSPFQTEKKKVVLYFWATWCPECKEKLNREFPAFQFPAETELVTVNTDKELDRIQHMMEKEKIKLTVVRDGKKALTSDLKVFSVPFWAVLSRGADGSWELVDSESGGNLDKMKAALAKGG